MTEADRRFRKNLVVFCLIAAPLLLSIGDVITSGIYEDDNDAKYLANIAANETQFYVGNLIGAAGAFFLPIATLGLVHLVRVRKRIYGTVAGVVALVGAFGMGGAYLVGSLFEYIMAQQPDRVAMVALMKDLESDATTPLFFIWMGFFIGILLVGIGLLLARTVPRYAAAGVIVAFVALFMSEGGVTSAIAGSLIVAAWGAIAWSIWKRTPEQFENGDLPDEQRPAQAMPEPAPASA